MSHDTYYEFKSVKMQKGPGSKLRLIIWMELPDG